MSLSKTRSRRSLNSSKSTSSLSKTCQNFKPTKVEKTKFKKSASIKKLEKRLSSGKIDSTPIKINDLVEEPIKDVSQNETNNNIDGIKKEEKSIPGKTLGVIPAMYEMWKKQRKKKLESPNKNKTPNSSEEQSTSSSTIKLEEQSFVSKRNRKMDFSFSKEKKQKKPNIRQVRCKREEDIIPTTKENTVQTKESVLLTSKILSPTKEDVDQSQDSQNSEANETMDKSTTIFPFWKSKRHKSKKSNLTKSKKEKVSSPRKEAISEVENSELNVSKPNKQESNDNQSNTEHSNTEIVSINAIVTTNPVRKRGRPRKKQPHEKIELPKQEISTTNKVELKTPETDFEQKISETNHTILQNEVAETLDVKPKAKRGRKPKHKRQFPMENTKTVNEESLPSDKSIISEKMDAVIKTGILEESIGTTETNITKTENSSSKNKSYETDKDSYNISKPEEEEEKEKSDHEQSTTSPDRFDSDMLHTEVTRNLSTEQSTTKTIELEESLTEEQMKEEPQIPEAEELSSINNETKDTPSQNDTNIIEQNESKTTNEKQTEIDTNLNELTETECKEPTKIGGNVIKRNETKTEKNPAESNTNEDESTETPKDDNVEKMEKEDESSSSEEDVKYTPTKPVTRTKAQRIDYRNSLNSKIDKTDSSNPYKKSFLVKEFPQDEKSPFKTPNKNDETSDKILKENETSRDERTISRYEKTTTKLTRSSNANANYLETIDPKVDKTDASNPYKKMYSTSSRTRNSPNCLSIQKSAIEKTQKARVAKSLIEKAHILKKKKKLIVSPIKITIKTESINQGRPKRQTKSNFNKSDFVYEIKSSSGKRKYEIENDNKPKMKQNELKKSIAVKKCVPFKNNVLLSESNMTENMEEENTLTSIKGKFFN